MPMRTSAGHRELREAVHRFLSEPNIVEEIERSRPRGHGEPETYPARIYRGLGERGWLAPSWPVEYGGLGRSLSDAAAVAEELALHGVPDTFRVNAIDNAGETILAAGTAEQQRRFLPPIARGEMTVSVLYSEPDAGSDLVSLTTTATPGDDGSWTLTGRKMWSAHTALCDYGICAARTSTEPVPYRGISLFMVPLDQPGVSIRPVPGFNVEQLYEVVLTGAVAASDELIGPCGDALPLITRALGLERTGLGAYGRARRWLDLIIGAADDLPAERRTTLAAEIARLGVELEAARELGWEAVAALADGDDSAPACAGAKWWTSVLAQRAARLAWTYLGTAPRDRATYSTELESALLEAPGLTLAAGTSEMMLSTLSAALRSDVDLAGKPVTADLTGWQRTWAETLRDVTAGAGGDDELLWREITARGLGALTVPAERGGSGYGQHEACLLADALGRAGMRSRVLDGLNAAERATMATGGDGEVSAAESGRQDTAVLLRRSAYLAGLAEGAVAAGAARAGDRRQFGRPIAANQGVSFPLVMAHVRARGLGAFVRRLAADHDAGADVTVEARAVLDAAAEEALRAGGVAIQVHGAYGTTDAGPAARHYLLALTEGARLRTYAAADAGALRPNRAGCDEVRTPRHASSVLERHRRPPHAAPLGGADVPPDELDRGLHQLVEAVAARHGDQVAVAGADGSATFHELNVRANRLARRLRRKGVAGGATVGVSLERSIDLVVGLLAVLKAGAAYVPLDPEYPPERIEFMLRDSGASLLLTHEWQRDWLPGDVPATVCLDDAAELVDHEDEHNLDLPIDAGDLAYVMYTSGSTGTPKGVEIEHRGAVNRMLWDAARFGFGPGDTVLHHMSPCFDFSLWEIFAPLTTGARLLLARPGAARDTGYLTRLLRLECVTAVGFVPSLLDIVLEEEPGLAACPDLRYVFVGGEAVTTSLCRRVFATTKAELHNFYGPTEVTVDATSWHITPGDLDDSVPIGTALPNVTLHVLDETGCPVPPGVPGELYVGGVGVARGYRGRPELTGQFFPADPFAEDAVSRMYRTGDVVRSRRDGALEFLGRLDDQVKIRGFRIELGEVEEAMLAAPGIRHAVALPGGPDRQRLDALVVPADAASFDATAARASLAGVLPDYMIPSRITVVDALPLLPNGKVDRSALPQTSEPDVPAAEDGHDTVSRLTNLTARILGIPGADPDDDFFALGGTSLQAARFVVRARRDLGLQIDLATFLKYSSPNALAGHVSASSAPSPTGDDQRL